MNVELLDYTGCGHEHPGRYAANLLVTIKSTRLEQSPDTRAKIARMSWEEMEAELNAAANTIRSAWEFIDYTFQVTCVTRAYTHQQVRTRVGVSFAQQAMRVVDAGHFDTLMPDSVEKADGGNAWRQLMEQIRNTYQYYQQFGVPNQDCRGVLPTNVLTNIIVKANLRTLADLVGKRENLRAQGEYADVVREMAARALEVHPWVGPFLYPPRTRTPMLDKLLKTLLGDRSPVDAPEINDALKELDRLKGTWG